MLDFRITGEPKVLEGRSEDTCELLRAACDALYAGDGVEAERLLRKVMLIEPDQPDVLNRLATALRLQDRTGEAVSLVDQVIEKHPDYFFGSIAAAGRALSRRQLDKAQEILIELQRRESLHYTEFYALVHVAVPICVLKGERVAAQHWLSNLFKHRRSL